MARPMSERPSMVKPRGRPAVPDTAGRRLTAVVFVDIVGYSILMAQQEAATIGRWMALLREIIHPELARHRGSFVKSTGDGLLAEFPSARDAVNWARAVQRAMSRSPEPADAPDTGSPPLPIALRIAVHLGDVFTDPGGDIYGDGVNVAARLQEFADPGGIVISEAIYDLVRGHLDHPVRPLGLLQLKNIERPVAAFMLEPAALGLAAHWHDINIGQGWSIDADADTAAAELSQRAIALDRDNAMALAVRAHLRSYLFHDYDTALAGFERALASAPSDSFAWCLSAGTLAYVGRAEEGLRNLDRGLRLSPFDPELYYFYCIGAFVRYALGAYEDALKWARMSADFRADRSRAAGVTGAPMPAE